MISEKKLDFWINNNYNLLIEGRHGTGKSTIVIEAFNKHQLKWKYFSASTMDPWCDFIGVPKEKIDDKGNSYLDLIRPREFQNDEIEALFFDEIGRSHKKVRNAVLELIQFKSINGKKFKKLRFIWAATNPAEEDYDVEGLDPAQADRFHIKVDLPYAPHPPYFKKRYGSETANGALEWWNDLPINMKNKISPRRLDYALEIYQKQGDMRDVLPLESNVSKLIANIGNGSIAEALDKLLKNGDQNAAQTFLKQENNYTAAIGTISRRNDYLEFFLPLVEDEKISSLISENAVMREWILDHYSTFDHVVDNILEANTNRRLINSIRKRIHLGIHALPSKSEFDCKINLDCKIREPGRKEGRHQYNSVLNQVQLVKSITSDTTLRINSYKLIQANISRDIDKSQAIDTLEVLSAIINRSYDRTLDNLDSLHHLINFCFSVIMKEGSVDLRDLKVEHPNIGKCIDYGMKKKEGMGKKDGFYFCFERKTRVSEVQS